MGIVTIRATPGSSWAARAHTRTSAQGRWDLDLALEDLAGRAHGQPVSDPHDARVFVGRDAFADLRLEFRLGDLGARVEHDGGGDLLAVDGMWDADDRRGGHRGVLVEHLVDLAVVHVVAVAEDHVLGPVGDEVAAVLVAAGQVSDAEPAVADGRCRGLGLVQVAPSSRCVP